MRLQIGDDAAAWNNDEEDTIYYLTPPSDRILLVNDSQGAGGLSCHVEPRPSHAAIPSWSAVLVNGQYGVTTCLDRFVAVVHTGYNSLQRNNDRMCVVYQRSLQFRGSSRALFPCRTRFATLWVRRVLFSFHATYRHTWRELAVLERSARFRADSTTGGPAFLRSKSLLRARGIGLPSVASTRWCSYKTHLCTSTRTAEGLGLPGSG